MYNGRHILTNFIKSIKHQIEFVFNRFHLKSLRNGCGINPGGNQFLFYRKLYAEMPAAVAYLCKDLSRFVTVEFYRTGINCVLQFFADIDNIFTLGEDAVGFLNQQP